jgi:predicted Ser/Thr protein kinase
VSDVHDDDRQLTPDEMPTIPLDSASNQTPRHAPEELKLDVKTAQHMVGDRYRIESIAGEGGMGRVFVAHDQRLNRRVAIKFLTGVMGSTAKTQVLDEARAMAGIRHAGIAPVYEVICDGEAPFLVMGWIDGIELDAAWQNFDLKQRVALIAQIVSAVTELHDVGLLHLDIKPRNILVDRAGTPVLVDFGLARASAETPGTSSGGTPGYAAPEQFTHEFAPGPPSDVHALGVLLFRAMTNQLPWSTVSQENFLKTIQTTNPKMPEELSPGSPWPLQRITMAALERDPSLRYPDARSLGLDLARYMRGELVAARPSQLTNQFKEQIRQRQEDTRAWQRQGLVTNREAAQLDRLYETIQRAESHWIVDSRRLTISQVTLYLGGWLILLAMTVGLAAGWSALSDASWLRWALPGGMCLGTLAAAAMMQHSGQARLALAYLFTTCLLVPITIAVFLYEMGWFAADDGQGQLLKAIFDLPPSLSNIDLLVSAICMAAAAMVARHYLRSSGFAIVGVVGLIVAIIAAWSTTGMLVDTVAAWALLGIVLLLTGSTLLALGIPLNKKQQEVDRLSAPGREHLFDAWAILSGSIFLIVVGLTMLAWNNPSWYIPGVLAGPETSPSGSELDQLIPYTQSRSVAFIINGLLLILLSWQLGRVATSTCERLAELLRWIIPAQVIGGLIALEAQTSSTSAAWIWLGITIAASVGFTLASVRKQWRPFIASGLIGLACSFLTLLSDLRQQLDPATFDTAVIAIIVAVSVLGIGVMLLAGWMTSRTTHEH